MLFRIFLRKARDLRVSAAQNFQSIKPRALATKDFLLILVFRVEFNDVVNDKFGVAAKAARRPTQCEYGIRRILFLFFLRQLRDFFERFIKRFDSLVDNALSVHC